MKLVYIVLDLIMVKEIINFSCLFVLRTGSYLDCKYFELHDEGVKRGEMFLAHVWKHIKNI